MAIPVILIAEDNSDDTFLIRRTLENAGVPYPLQFVRDGEEAISYLKGEGQYSKRADHPLPDLVLLDLKLPRKDGFEVLQWMRQQPELKHVRVVVLTSSDDPGDVNAAYSLGADSYLVKPLDFENFLELGPYLINYWLVQNKPVAEVSL